MIARGNGRDRTTRSFDDPSPFMAEHRRPGHGHMIDHTQIGAANAGRHEANQDLAVRRFGEIDLFQCERLAIAVRGGC